MSWDPAPLEVWLKLLAGVGAGFVMLLIATALLGLAFKHAERKQEKTSS